MKKQQLNDHDVKPIKQIDPKNDQHHTVSGTTAQLKHASAGGLSGAITRAICQPFDVVKRPTNVSIKQKIVKHNFPIKMLWNPCRKKKHEPKPGEILDQVISQSSASANKCLLYKLANYKRGGDLIDALQIGGQLAVEQLIREQFDVFMYNNGKGQIINRAEYLRWKYMDNQEVTIPIEASLSPHDPLGKWVDHKACWQMQYRGSLGESLLHVLIICDTKNHTKLARLLLRIFPQLALDVMEGEEYLGASALHLAIAYSNNELVQDLIDAGAHVNQRAIGSFFLPRDQQGSKKAKNTDYEGLAYLGEYPLAWAACCANESVYNLLLDSNADPDAQDTFGNMILHMVVVCDKLDMFGYALRHPKTPARNGIINTAGLTPLTLACKLGRAEVFREMLELSAREFWRYSNITCSGYPLNALDTLLPDGTTNWNSALFIILNGTKEEHLDMLDGGIIQRLLEEKWKTFARRVFLKRLLILALHLFCLSTSIYLRPATENMAKIAQALEENGGDALKAIKTEPKELDARTVIRYGSEICTILGVLSYVILQQGDEVKNQGLSAFIKQLLNAPAKAIFLVSNFMILACIPFRLIGDTDTEEAILLFAVPGSWFLLMFFAGAVRLTGPFVTMIYSMLTGDMFTFGIIYSIVLFGFSQAFYFLYKGHPQSQSTQFSSYPSTWMGLLQTTLGDYSYPDLNSTTYPNLAKTVFVIFMIFVPILLLNMLIAMMGNTYARVIEQSEKEWMKQWAKIVVNLERAVSHTDAKKYLEEYSIGLGPALDDSGYEQRGVMVIKSKSKTRAKQRKGAVSNWKRVGKVTLNALKKRGMTGEELRRVMWGRTSISTPTKVSNKPKRNLTGDPYDVGHSVGAIGAALDVMSFTQEIVMGDETIATSIINPKGNKLDPPGNIPLNTTIHNHGMDSKHFRDPLRELVLISEAIAVPDTNYLNNVKSLAKAATVLDNVKEINVGQGISAAKKPDDKNIATLGVDASKPNTSKDHNLATSNIFKSANEIVNPEREKEFLKKLEAIEDSDGDEKPVLGKISLIRRAKSAVLRSSSGKKKSDQHPLFQIAWDSPPTDETLATSGLDQGHTNYGYTTTEQCVVDIENDDEIIVTVDEVKQKMEQFHLNRRSSPDSESNSERQKKSAKMEKKFSKTRTTISKNRVSPTTEGGSKEKRGKSAPQPMQSGKTVEPGSPPDPLEPWSTRDILDLNKILDSK